jgi:hypothetical protein
MRNKYFLFGMIIFCIFLFPGCAVHTVPNPGEVGFSELPQTDNQPRIKIINDQNNSTEITIGSFGLGTIVGDLHTWTDSAVDSAKKSLAVQGVTISDNSSKLLKFAVTDAKLDTWGVVPAGLARCKIVLKVGTGDGYSQTYEGTNKSANAEWACNKAMYSAVSYFLEDKAIHNYLVKKDAPEAKKTDSRFINNGNGTVMDTKTGLMWAAKDNGSDIKWADAKSYCENYRGGGYTDWRMPTSAELEGLYDAGQAKPSACYKSNLVHVATELIDITCHYLWASETREHLGFIPQAAYFYFAYGGQYWVRQSYKDTYRVLPVRTNK